MSKLTEFVRLEDLAKEYQKIISNRFNIEVNSNTKINGTRENAVMLATRQPYKISNIKAESLQVVLRFYTCCENRSNYNDTIQQLSQLAGLNKGTFTSNGNIYKYYSFLDFTQPLGEPIVDTGKYHQAVELMGTVLVTQAEGGVLIGNEVETEITLDLGTEHPLSGKIEVLSSSMSIIKTQESPQMSNESVAMSFNNTQAYSYGYTILLMKNQVCERIFKAIKRIEPFGLNEEIQIKETYPPFTTGGEPIIDNKSFIVASATLDRNAGAFVVANLTFQDRLDIENLDDEE